MGTDEFKELLSRGTPRVTVVGGGYVGLPLAVAAAQAGCKVTILDVDKAKVDAINAGESYIGDVPSARLAYFVHERRLLHATTAPSSAYAGAHAVLICVPTPLQLSREPDLSLVNSALRPLNIHLSTTNDPVLVVLESTVYPGFTREEVHGRLGVVEGTHTVHVAFSPERVDPMSRAYGITNTPKVVGGIDRDSTEIACALYRRFVERVVPVSSSDAAELVKLLENTYRAVNIALANEFAIAAESLGIDIWEVIDAAATKPFGFQKFVPGCGVGGHCIPDDPPYLSWKMRALGQEMRLLNTAMQLNREMPHYAVRRLTGLLNDGGRCLKGSRILVVGVAYKPDVSDTRESPALDIIRELEHMGSLVTYLDPHVPSLEHEGLKTSAVDEAYVALLNSESCRFDAAIIATGHNGVDYAKLCNSAPIVLDTRGVTRGLAGISPATRVVTL